MQTLTPRFPRVLVLAAAFAGTNTMAAAAQDLSLTGGSGVYASDAFCLDTGALFSVVELSGGGDLFGGSVAHSNGSHPWIPPDAAASALAAQPGNVNLSGGLRPGALRAAASQQNAFLANGRAIRIMAEAFPVALLARLPGQREGALRDINRYVRPFVGAGVHISGDGTAAPAGTNGRDLPTFGLEGSTNLILSYGARAYLPGRDSRLRLVVTYRGNTMFMNDVVYRTPDNETLRRDGKTLTWGEWGVGVSVRIGS